MAHTRRIGQDGKEELKVHGAKVYKNLEEDNGTQEKDQVKQIGGVKCTRACIVIVVYLHRCLTYTTFRLLISSGHVKTQWVSITQGSHPTWCRRKVVLHGCLLGVSVLVVVSGAVVEQQRIEDLEQQLHHVESAVQTRVAQLDA